LKGWPLGSDEFKAELQHKVQRQVLPAKRGRPFKAKETGA
jgi:putative transposase